MTNITVGCDPELFVSTEENEIISAIGMIGGSKEFPKKVKKGALQEDNVLAEFNIDPAYHKKDFLNNIDEVIHQLEKQIYPNKLVFKSSHEFDTEYLIGQGEKALAFGCDPDLNCWTQELNPAPDSYTGLRTAGGHVHIGYEHAEVGKSLEVAKMCEYLMGIPSVLMDNDVERRKLYGAAGSIRIKAYGVEYRVLSNFWLQSNIFKSWIFEQARRAVLWLDKLPAWEKAYPGEEVQRIINKSDVDKASDVIQCCEIPVPRRYINV